MHSFRVRLDTQKDRDRVLPRIFRSAMREPIAILMPTRGTRLFRIAAVAGNHYRYVEAVDPNRIVGVYALRGEPAALLKVLMEDLKDAAAARLA